MFVEFDGRSWYRIADYDRMEAFFMSITNPDNIWLFISSTGGISCGRRSKDSALFPYTTVDKVSENHHNTGSYTAMHVERGGRHYLWEPLRWQSRNMYHCSRNLYKTVYGDSLLFEEINEDLGLKLSVLWEASPAFGIHRTVELTNVGREGSTRVLLLDGLRNILPAGVTALAQTNMSSLLDAYKRSEADAETGLGIYALSATQTDLAEPSESLLATTLWSYGLEGSTVLLSEQQLDRFGGEIRAEHDVKGRRCAYFLCNELLLGVGESREWGFCADVEQDHTQVHNLRQRLQKNRKELVSELHEDLRQARQTLETIIAHNDGIQQVGSKEGQYHHALNVLFNVMRGGYFIEGYTIQRENLKVFMEHWNAQVFQKQAAWLNALPETLHLEELIALGDANGDPHLRRLLREYLPLTFSRRHGDPSRPWNDFFIQTRDADGYPLVGYQGNWRDIFQNWEALCISWPAYLPSIISKFLNATTADGYNPYRISEKGIDWEVPEPDNPWANIGYWSDHQIIYLCKLLEHNMNMLPEALNDLFTDDLFVCAHVPYRIRSFEELTANPYDSIVFDHELHATLKERAEGLGADGLLLSDASDQPIRVTMLEKLLTLFLAKLANYVAGGGIWMNTQRPEWNDANNALVGWGLSMVTLSYLLRFIDVFSRLLDNNTAQEYELTEDLLIWFEKSAEAMNTQASDALNDEAARWRLLESLGTAACEYRRKLYSQGMGGRHATLSKTALMDLLKCCGEQFHASIEAARLEDGCFESYQVLELREGMAGLRKLYLMLEGQIAGLSLTIHEPDETLKVLKALRKSLLYREDQHSYMLYPNRKLPGFLAKNTVRESDIAGIISRHPSEWQNILCSDNAGQWHFNGAFRNVKDLRKAAAHLGDDELSILENAFEACFDHRSFTGRSGTFFAYEGLGSIYWHMVSKLLLATQERLIQALRSAVPHATVQLLKEAYIDIRNGLGFNKTPEVYGAFPIDPYSHSPWGRGAKQPGMTGQVKEEVLTRYGELGLVVQDGAIWFYPDLILDDQWLNGQFSFSYCGVLFEVRQGDSGIAIYYSDGSTRNSAELCIEAVEAKKIFLRTGEIQSVSVGTLT